MDGGRVGDAGTLFKRCPNDAVDAETDLRTAVPKHRDYHRFAAAAPRGRPDNGHVAAPRGLCDGDLLLEGHNFQIRFATTARRWTQRGALIHHSCAWRSSPSGELRDEPPSFRSITLRAGDGATVFGTVDICFDCEAGLPADASYRAEIDSYRALGAQAAQVTRLAVDAQHGSKEFLGALFHLLYIFLGLEKTTHIFIEVHPQHAAFYRRMLHFRRLGECTLCERVDAPAVLMHVELSYVREQIGICGGHQHKARTLYPYFCSKEQENAIVSRVLSLYHNESVELHA